LAVPVVAVAGAEVEAVAEATDPLGTVKTLVKINLLKVLLYLKLVHPIQLPSVEAVVVVLVMAPMALILQ
jgi:hypothetical protein